MKGIGGIVCQVLFLLYVWISYPEYAINDLEYATAYKAYVYFSVIILFVYAFEYYMLEGAKGLLHANVLICTSIIYWLYLDLLQDRYVLDNLQSESIKTAFISVSIFVITIQITSNLTFKIPDLVVNASRFDISSKTLYASVFVCFSLAIFFFYKASYYDFNHMIRGLTKSRFASPWARGVTGGFDALLEHLKYFGYMLPPLTALHFMINRFSDYRNYVALLLTIGFSMFEFQGGGRRITGFLAGSLLMTILIYKRFELQLRHFLFVGIAGIGLLILLDMQLMFRNIGYTGMFDKYEINQLNEVRVDDNFLRLTQIIDLIPSQFPHSGMEYLVWSFSRPIPRAVWPNKPLGPGFDVANMVGAQGVTLTSTVVGESYASMGYVMIVIVGTIFGVLSGTLSQLLDRKLGVMGVALYAIGALALVGGVRSLPDLVVFSYAFLGLLLMYKLLSRRS